MRPTTLPTLAALVAFPLLAGAQAAPQAPTPPAPAPQPPASTAPVAEPPAIPAVEFDDAIRRAAQHATAAAIAEDEVRRAEALLIEARSASLPFLAATGTASRVSWTQVGGRPIGSQDQRNGNLSLSVPLVAPSRWTQWSHASDAVAVARAGQQDTRRIVTLLAARAYLAILAQKRAVDVSRRAVQTAAAHFDFARTRRRGGVGNALDEARSDQQLATAQSQLENAVTGLVRAQEALGIAVAGDGPLDARGEPDLRFAGASTEDALREAEASRADLRAARERALAAHRVARDSWADWLPTLSAVGQAFVQDPATLVTPSDGWQAQLVLTLPLFEGGLRVGQQRERAEIEAEASAQLQGSTLQARSEVRTAFTTLQHAEAALEQSRRGAQRAQSALTLVTEAYRAGATTSLDVTDAEQRARDADTAAVVAEDAVRQARLDLLAATGRFP